MFDFQIPQSLAEIPGRFVNLCWDEDEVVVKPLRPKQTHEQVLARERARYARNREKIAAKRRAQYANRTPEQIEAKRQKSREWMAKNWVRLQLRKAEQRKAK